MEEEGFKHSKSDREVPVDCVRGKTTARGMWKSLLAAYEKTGIVSEMFLRKKLLSMKYVDGESMERHFGGQLKLMLGTLRKSPIFSRRCRGRTTSWPLH